MPDDNCTQEPCLGIKCEHSDMNECNFNLEIDVESLQIKSIRQLFFSKVERTFQCTKHMDNNICCFRFCISRAPPF